MRPNPTLKNRITNRVPQPVALKLQEAADITGATLNQFMIEASLEKAEGIIDRERTIHFSKNDATLIINLLDNPAQPNAALAKAFERFKHREIENGNHSSPTRNMHNVICRGQGQNGSGVL